MNENLGDDASGLEPDNNHWGIVHKQYNAVKEDSRKIGSAARSKPPRPKGPRDDNPRKRPSISRKRVQRAAVDRQKQTKTPYRQQITAPSMAFPCANNRMAPYVPYWGTGPVYLPPRTYPMLPQQPSPFSMNYPFFPAVTSNCHFPPLFHASPNTYGEQVVIFGNKKDVYVRTENKNNYDKPEYILVDPLCGKIGFGSHLETKIILQMNYKEDTISGPIHGNSNAVHFIVSGANRKVFRCQQLHGRFWLQEVNWENDATGTQPRVNTSAASKEPTPPTTHNSQQPTAPVVLPSIPQVPLPVPQQQSTKHESTNCDIDSRWIGPPASLQPPRVLATNLTGAAAPTLTSTTTAESQPPVTQLVGLSGPIASTASAAHRRHHQEPPNTPSPPPRQISVAVPGECISLNASTVYNEELHSVPDSTQTLAAVSEENASPTVVEIPSPGAVLRKVGNDGREQILVMTKEGDCHTPVHSLNGMIGFSSHRQALFAVQNYFPNFRVHVTSSQESFTEYFELYNPSSTSRDDHNGFKKTFRSVFRHGRFWLEEHTLQAPEPNCTPQAGPRQNSIVNLPVPRIDQLTVTTVPSPDYVPAPTRPQPQWVCRAPNEYEYCLLSAARRIDLRPLHSVNGRSGFASQRLATSALLSRWNGSSLSQPQLPDLGGGSIEYLVLESMSGNDKCVKSNNMFRIVKSSGRYWVEEVGLQNRLERDCYREVI
jgi:hypothetical protein